MTSAVVVENTGTALQMAAENLGSQQKSVTQRLEEELSRLLTTVAARHDSDDAHLEARQLLHDEVFLVKGSILRTANADVLAIEDEVEKQRASDMWFRIAAVVLLEYATITGLCVHLRECKRLDAGEKFYQEIAKDLADVADEVNAIEEPAREKWLKRQAEEKEAERLRLETTQRAAEHSSVTKLCSGCGVEFGKKTPNEPWMVQLTGKEFHEEKRYSDNPDHWTYSFCWQCAQSETRCHGCGHVFEPTETVYLRRLRRARLYQFCETCAPAEGWVNPVPVEDKPGWVKFTARGPLPLDETFWPSQPCECKSCQRPVRLQRPASERAMNRIEYYGRHFFCSTRCRWRQQLDQRKRARRATKTEHRCVVCGQPIVDGRRDAKTCSAACRQRSYRERGRKLEKLLRTVR